MSALRPKAAAELINLPRAADDGDLNRSKAAVGVLDL